MTTLQKSPNAGLQIKVSAPQLILALGKKTRSGVVWNKRAMAVDGLDDASDKWAAICAARGLLGSTCPAIGVFDSVSGEQVATITYNARVWDMAGKEIKIGDRKTCAELDVEGWN